MQYQKVDSSQIESVGYEPETSTLGVKFHPTKKQKEAEQPGSEYHYSHVPTDMFTALVDAISVGKFFGERIKPFPNVYPYRKIEPEA